MPRSGWSYSAPWQPVGAMEPLASSPSKEHHANLRSLILRTQATQLHDSFLITRVTCRDHPSTAHLEGVLRDPGLQQRRRRARNTHAPARARAPRRANRPTRPAARAPRPVRTCNLKKCIRDSAVQRRWGGELLCPPRHGSSPAKNFPQPVVESVRRTFSL